MRQISSFIHPPPPPHPGYARPCTPHSSVQAEGLDAEEECGAQAHPGLRPAFKNARRRAAVSVSIGL